MKRIFRLWALVFAALGAGFVGLMALHQTQAEREGPMSVVKSFAMSINPLQRRVPPPVNKTRKVNGVTETILTTASPAEMQREQAAAH